jgi:hypothetical protein
MVLPGTFACSAIILYAIVTVFLKSGFRLCLYNREQDKASHVTQ